MSHIPVFGGTGCWQYSQSVQAEVKGMGHFPSDCSPMDRLAAPYQLCAQERTESALAAFTEGQGAQKATGKGQVPVPQHTPQVRESLAWQHPLTQPVFSNHHGQCSDTVVFTHLKSSLFVFFFLKVCEIPATWLRGGKEFLLVRDEEQHSVCTAPLNSRWCWHRLISMRAEFKWL